MMNYSQTLYQLSYERPSYGVKFSQTACSTKPLLHREDSSGRASRHGCERSLRGPSKVHTSLPRHDDCAGDMTMIRNSTGNRDFGRFDSDIILIILANLARYSIIATPSYAIAVCERRKEQSCKRGTNYGMVKKKASSRPDLNQQPFDG